MKKQCKQQRSYVLCRKDGYVLRLWKWAFMQAKSSHPANVRNKTRKDSAHPLGISGKIGEVLVTASTIAESVSSFSRSALLPRECNK